MGTLILCVFFFANFDVKNTTEITCDGFRPRYNMFNIFFAMGTFTYTKESHGTVVHLFSMNFNGFRSFRLYVSLKCPFPVIKSSHNGNTIYMRLLSIKDSTKIELFYLDDNSSCIAQWVLGLTCYVCGCVCGCGWL